MNRVAYLLMIGLLATNLYSGQTGRGLTTEFAGAPTGSCSPMMRGIDTTTGDEYNCVDLSWHKISNGGAATWSNEEGPSGAINGSNVTFTLSYTPIPSTSLRLVLNGLTLRSGAGNDFTLAGNTITFAYAPTGGSNLICWYQY